MKKLVLLSVLAVIYCGVISGQSSYYVSMAGDDDGAGTFDDPWQTIQFAMDVAEAGSTVYIMAGVYNERVYVNVSGSAGNMITFRNYNNDEVVIDGSGLSDPALCEIYDRHYVRLQGIHFRNNAQPDAMGIFVEGNCNNIEIIECIVSEIHFSSDPNAAVNENTNAQPVIVYGTGTIPITDLKIIDCWVFDCRTGYSEGVAVNGNVDGFEISGNTVHDITNIGIDAIGHEGTCPDPGSDQARNGYIDWNTVYNCQSPYASAAGIYVDGGRDIIIESNQVYNNQWGIEVGCENPGKTASGIVVRNNFIHGNASGGIQLGGYDYPSGSGKVTDCYVVNNSLFNNAVVNHYDGELTLTFSENSVIVNNIFYATNPEGQLLALEDVAGDLPGLVLDHNLWYHPDGEQNVYIYWNGDDYESFAAFQSGTGHSVSAQFTDPSFASDAITDPNLHLEEDSPAIAAAAQDYESFAGNKDIDDEDRVKDVLDKGADEYHAASGIAGARSVDHLAVYPNPARDHVFISLLKNGNEAVSIRIFDLQGRAMMFVDAFSGQAIDISHLKAGLYTICMFEGMDLKARAKLAVR